MRFTLTDTFCIHHADLELNKITVLMGDNGCGKTICTVLLGNLVSAVCSIHAPAACKPSVTCTLTDKDGNVIASEEGMKPCSEITSVIQPLKLGGKLPPTPIRWATVNKRIESLIGGKFIRPNNNNNNNDQDLYPCHIQRNDGSIIESWFFSRFDHLLYLLSHYMRHEAFAKDALWTIDALDVGLSSTNIVELADLLIQIQQISQMRIVLTSSSLEFTRALRTLGKNDVSVYLAHQSEADKTMYDYTLVRSQKQLADYARLASTALQDKLAVVK